MSKKDVSDVGDVLRRIIRDSIFSAPARLSIMIYLLARNKAYFTELQQVLNLTPGNLNSHLRRLKDAGYIEIIRTFEDRPRTIIKITKKGMDETLEYLNRLLTISKSIMKS